MESRVSAAVAGVRALQEWRQNSSSWLYIAKSKKISKEVGIEYNANNEGVVNIDEYETGKNTVVGTFLHEFDSTNVEEVREGSRMDESLVEDTEGQKRKFQVGNKRTRHLQQQRRKAVWAGSKGRTRTNLDESKEQRSQEHVEEHAMEEDKASATLWPRINGPTAKRKK